MIRDGGKEIAVLARLQIHGVNTHDILDIHGGIPVTHDYYVNENISEVVCLSEDIEAVSPVHGQPVMTGGIVI